MKKPVKDFFLGCWYGVLCSPLTALATCYGYDLLHGYIPLQGLANAVEYLITGK